MLGYSLEWPAGVPVSRALPNTCPPTLTPAAAPIDTRRPRYSSKESTTGWHCLAVRLKALLVFSGGVPAGSTINEAEAMLRYAQRCHARQLHRCDNVLSSNLHRHRLEKTPSSC